MQTPGSASHRWITVLLLLPLLVLLAIGFSLLSRDRRSVEIEARQNADSSARRFLSEFWRAATNFEPATFLNLTNPWPRGVLFFQTGTNGELTWPPPLDHSPQIDLAHSLTPAQSNLWSAAARAEFPSHDLPEALAQWEKLLNSEPLSNRVAAVARFSHAVLLERSGNNSAAAAEFDSLTQAAPEYHLDSGLPIAPLAGLKRL